MRRVGVDKFSQGIRSVADTEHRPARLEGDAGLERTCVDGVEPKPIDEAHHRGDRIAVIARRGQSETIGRTP